MAFGGRSRKPILTGGRAPLVPTAFGVFHCPPSGAPPRNAPPESSRPLCGRGRRIAFAAVLVAAAFIGCGEPNPGERFLSGFDGDGDEMAALFLLLDGKDASPDSNFAVAREISGCFLRAGDYGKLIRFLSDRTQRFPDDPYNAHHLLMIAHAYMKQGSLPISALYFDAIVRNYPDMTVNGSSIHLASLLNLTELVDDPRRLARYYGELLSRFPGDVNRGVLWFRLAGVLEEIGEWADAIEAYSAYVSLGSPAVPGFAEAAARARLILNFHNSSRDWTFESLEALTAAVKSALDNNSVARLAFIQAKTNFFTRSWGQGDADSRYDFLITRYFGPGTRVRHADGFLEESNGTGVYLRTWGWPQVISVWYLYFRKVDFPADPSVHGRWEWAGIYFGENF